MNTLIIAHETKTLTASPALHWIFLILLIAMGFGAWTASNTLERQARGAAAIAAFEDSARAKMRADLAKYEAEVAASGGKMEFAPVNHAPGAGPPQGTNAGAVGSETASHAVLPATGLAALSIGQSDMNLQYLPVSMRGVIDVTKEAEIENPVNLKSGAFDVAFVIVFLLPIFILAMSYDLLSSEKERGTLAMVLSHPITLNKLTASKMVTRSMLILAVVLAFGVGAVAAVGSDLGNPATWLRFAAWVGAAMLYSLFWFALAVLVNALGKSSATNGMILAGSWLVFVVVVPTLVSIVATTLYPAPSRMDFIVAAREAQTGAEFERMKALDQYYYDHVELVPDAADKANDFLTLAMANAASVEKAVMPLYATFRTRLAEQEAAVTRFQVLSPALMTQRALNEISGTSGERYAQFVDQAITYQKQWTDFFAGRFLKKEPLRTTDYDLFPKFNYVEESLSTVMGRIGLSLGALLVVVGALLTAAFMALRRYSVAER